MRSQEVFQKCSDAQAAIVALVDLAFFPLAVRISHKKPQQNLDTFFNVEKSVILQKCDSRHDKNFMPRHFDTRTLHLYSQLQ